MCKIATSYYQFNITSFHERLTIRFLSPHLNNSLIRTISVVIILFIIFQALSLFIIPINMFHTHSNSPTFLRVCSDIVCKILVAIFIFKTYFQVYHYRHHITKVMCKLGYCREVPTTYTPERLLTMLMFFLFVWYYCLCQGWNDYHFFSIIFCFCWPGNLAHKYCEKEKQVYRKMHVK